MAMMVNEIYYKPLILCFADPKAIPYYAQKLVRGAANIPEFILSTPKAGAAFIKDLKTNAGITKGGVEEILEILDPSITRDILNGEFGNLVGLSDQAIQAQKKKDRVHKKQLEEY